MPAYRIRTFRAGEGFRIRQLSAESESEAIQQTERGGWRVVNVEASAVSRWGAPWRRRSKFSLEGFTQELLTLLDAGMSLVEAIDVLASKPRDLESKRILDELRRLLSEGKAVSAALGSLPDAFHVLFVATLRSSERTGNLPEALRRYLAYHCQINLVRDKLVSAAIYPAILMAVSACLMVFLMGWVVPRFSRIYADMGDRMPYASRMMVAWSSVLEEHGALVGISFVALLAIIVVMLSRPTVRAALLKAVFRIPSVGERIKLYQLARFTRTLAMLQTGGIPFVPALGMVGELLHQPVLRHGLAQAQRRISEGGSVSEAFAQNALATEVGVRLLMVGERSGDLPGMLARIANLYDQELEKSVEWFSRLLEPVLMIIVGLVIGVVILLMYLPIFELANLVQ